jgi:hypothetical protein
MLYMLLCYNNESEVMAWTPAEEGAVMAGLAAVQDRLYAEGKLGPSARLQGTSSAKTLVKTSTPFVVDGPYAETKEQFLGFYVLNVADMDEALGIARELGAVNPGGAYEVRPVMLYAPGTMAG